MKIVKKVNINTFEELNNKILFNFKKLDGYIFRGHGKSSYKLVPLLLRDSHKYNSVADICISELALLMKFYRVCNNEGLTVPDIKSFKDEYLVKSFDLSIAMSKDNGFYWLDDKVSELAALAQHYGVPTRLLDWTQDVYVALYFATEIVENEDIAIWAIDGRSVQEFKHYQLDIISINSQVIYSKCDSKISYERIYGMLDDSLPLKFYVPHYDVNHNIRAQKGILSIWQDNLIENAHDGDEKIFSDILGCNKKLSEKIHSILDHKNTVYSLDEMLRSYFSNKANLDDYKKIISDKELDDYAILYEFVINKELVLQIRDMLNFHGYNTMRIYPSYKTAAVYTKQCLNWK